MTKGYLHLSTGDVFEGELLGATGKQAGEVVFTTSMTGYQETLTDPSYAGQVLTFCYPMVGNYGLLETANESTRPAVAGIVTGEMWDPEGSFSTLLMKWEIPGLSGIDTRALVKTIRQHNTVTGIISDTASLSHPWKTENSLSLVHQVSVTSAKTYGEGNPHVVMMDYGYKKSILDSLLKRGCKVTVVPFTTTLNEMKELCPDAVVFSNGPGDPKALEPYFTQIKKISESWPAFGICFGHQLIALAYGGSTEKQLNGHRGSNHPVKEMVSGKVRMTSQNHGYVVKNDYLPSDFHVTYKNVNDGTVEGIRHNTLPVQSVQFHPEAHPGPSDTDYLFDDFIKQTVAAGGKLYA
ncbi:carbamoyl phosphate synthase small subunit [Alteribacter keqinensis]|uniref:Carbamoyl phosphate synthase small chain n=1 Tax=Alteribacter keqinensis TaxID=2483800 RepID=A0A3M7TX97_9BACI|nr:carbamoyl phosphate synthase small subunit [Alteribacter keqinensis]RNA69901.1 carbamoyl phosphate synthase small subunit [Alteribacter keqinensis]